MNINRLTKKAKRGNKDALLELIMMKKDDYYRLAYSYMKNEDDAMNTLQDMIVKLYENIDKLRDNKKFYSWSKTILVNVCKDELERSKKLISIEDIGDFKEDIRDRDIDMEGDLMVDEILSGLDEKYEEIIRLKHILGYDYKSIAEILDIPVGTAKSRVHNGMKILEKMIKETE